MNEKTTQSLTAPDPAEPQCSADSELDALRWRQLPAHLEEVQIDYVCLKRAIDADLADPQIVAALRTEPQTAGRAPADQNCPIGSSDPSVCSAGCCIRCSDWRDGFNAARSQAESAPQADMEEKIAALAHRFWSIHPSTISAMNLTREEFYAREITKLIALTRPE
jgi:hypothetical protein